MRLLLYFLLFISIIHSSCQQSVTNHVDQKLDISEIKTVLNAQADQWNKGSIDDFMSAYWNSEELCFIGSKGLTKGWKTTLENYHKSYPDTETMGKLRFDILELRFITEGVYYMVGRYTLERAEDEPTGIFMLIWKKIDGQWKIIADQTCG